MALMTGTGGGDGERDILMAIDQLQLIVDIDGLGGEDRYLSPATLLFFSLATSFILFDCGVGILGYLCTTSVKRRALCTFSRTLHCSHSYTCTIHCISQRLAYAIVTVLPSTTAFTSPVGACGDGVLPPREDGKDRHERVFVVR